MVQPIQMTDLFLKLVGAKVDDTVRIVEASLDFHGGIGIGWLVLAMVSAAGTVYWMYRRSPATLSPLRLYSLAALRFVFLSLILLLLMRPVLSLTVEGSVRRMLALLIDGSASMQIKDPRLERNDRVRAAIARGELKASGGLAQTPESGLPNAAPIDRLSLVKQVLKNEDLNLLPQLDREFDLSAFSFGRGLVEISAHRSATVTNAEPATPTAGVNQFPWVEDLKAESPVTALGDAAREVMNRKRGQPLAAILLVTDGANNSGTQPREIASLCRQEGLPLYIYGVGITSPRDIIVGNLFAPDVSFVKDEVAVTVRLKSQGLAGQEAELVLKLGPEVVARRTVTFAADGEQVVPMQFVPQAPGEFDLTASIDPRPDETVQDNNARTQRLRVVDTKIKVLLVDQSPRWEFRYLQAMLLRDRRVDLKCVLVEADPDVARAKDSPYLEKFPARKEDLFQYDLVLYGDVDPKAVSAAQLENLSELVSRFGGALVLIAGRRFAPQAYRRGIMDNMLPVEYDSLAIEPAQDAAAEKPIHLELTSAGRANSMLRLSDKPEENVALWKELPPVYWVAKVSRPKPAAEVLLVDPDPAKETRFGKMPVVAVQQYGLGQVMFVGTDNTWRWRKNVGDRYYTTLWGQIAQRVSLQRLLGVSKRTQLSTDRQNYMTGDRVTVYARLYSTGYEPMREPSVKGIYGLKNGTGPRPEVTLRPIPEQPGLYRGEFVAPAAGAYQFFVEHDLNAPLEFNVNEPQFELGETAMNEPLLRELAAASGGAFFREEDLHRLPETISSKTERVRSPLEVELWASPFYFLILLGVVTVEWVLRKMSYLK
jgi:hypothetical protein